MKVSGSLVAYIYGIRRNPIFVGKTTCPKYTRHEGSLWCLESFESTLQIGVGLCLSLTIPEYSPM